jgi:monofunctional biosynthetic peptidoglycan transglycosylase
MIASVHVLWLSLKPPTGLENGSEWMRIQAPARQIVFVYRSFSALFTIIGVVVAVATAWFVPWVLTLHLGTLVYFPYLPKSDDRFIRITGPWSGPYAQNWVASESIPQQCKLALVAAEDTKFFTHSGIDFESLEQSYKYNLKQNKKSRGGSTITQQIVKNAFLSRKKSYIRKAREFVGAILLDAFSSKDMQLTWYFNIVEFGPKIYGLKDAARFYFKKNPNKLTSRECASLVAILPSPNRWNASLIKGAPSGFLASRVRVIQARMQILAAYQKQLADTAARKPEKTKRAGGQSSNSSSLAQGDKKKAAETPVLNRAGDLNLPAGPVDAWDRDDFEGFPVQIEKDLPEAPDLPVNGLTEDTLSPLTESELEQEPGADTLPYQKMYEILDPFENSSDEAAEPNLQPFENE